MRALILGHSFVKGLERRDVRKQFLVNQRSVDLTYKAFPGATFRTFLDEPTLIDTAIECDPDIVVIILGGNDITGNVTNTEIRANIKEFFELLKQKVKTGVKILATQVEARTYITPNHRNCPGQEEYRLRRNAINKYLQKLKLKDYLVNIAGPGRLDNPSYFRGDGVHLNSAGYHILYVYIKHSIEYALTHREI